MRRSVIKRHVATAKPAWPKGRPLRSYASDTRKPTRCDVLWPMARGCPSAAGQVRYWYPQGGEPMMSTPAQRSRSLLDGGVDPQRGFLPAVDPLTHLPGAFAVWDEVGLELPKLLAAARARSVLSRLPALDPGELPDAAIPRAMVLLSFFGHAYVYQSWQTDVADRLPAAVARPWVAIASRLGRPPILSYASYALDNWRRLDPQGPIVLGNLALLQNFLGGLDEEWFITVHIQIEVQAAAALVALPRAQRAVADRDGAAVTAALGSVAAALGRMNATLLRMPENCDPYIYYHRVRPFIHGWQQHPVVYEGVAEYRGAPRSEERRVGKE